jgi:competence protein ComFC
MISLFIDILFPSRCAGCGRPVSAHQDFLCDSCARSMPILEGACPVCSGPGTEGACPVCAGRHWYLDANITVAEYRGVMKNVLRELKFGRVRKLHAVLGTLASGAVAGRGVPADIITWVPMNARKKQDRGFNQSELIARFVSKQAGIPCRKLLSERRGAGVQRRMGVRDRFINILDRYEAAAGIDLSGQSVLLVDDIFTTGATVNECARQLKNAGARSVISITLARADIKRLKKNNFFCKMD